MNGPVQRETIAMSQLSDGHFGRLQVFARQHWGLELRTDRRELIQGCLQAWAQRNPGSDVEGVFRRVISGRATRGEGLALFEELAVTHTSFHREPVHFQCLIDEVVLPRLRAGNRRLRLWSAGCATGCEPYSLAMTLRDRVADIEKWDLRILATDLSISALRRARSGLYEFREVEALTAETRARHFVELPSGQYRVAPVIRDTVTFKLLNLMGEWPMQGPFDAIFCRNVLLYQRREESADMVRRFAELLAPGGLLVLGCAETLPGVHTSLQRIGPSVYCRVPEEVR